MILTTYLTAIFTKLGINAGNNRLIAVPKLAFVDALCDLLKDYEAVDLDNDEFIHDLCTKLDVEDSKAYRKVFKKMWKKISIRKIFVHRILQDNRKVENYGCEDYNEDELYQEFENELHNSVGYLKSQSGIGEQALREYRTDESDSDADEIIVYMHESQTSIFAERHQNNAFTSTGSIGRGKGVRV